MSARSYLSIGDVLTLLRQEFPDITISKIRFLESQGLVNPERTPSGYRKFYEHDVERLRWVLRQQRENFLPLKVIKDRLDDGSAETPTATAAARAPVTRDHDRDHDHRGGDSSDEGRHGDPVLVGQRVGADAESRTHGSEPTGEVPLTLVGEGSILRGIGSAGDTGPDEGSSDSSAARGPSAPSRSGGRPPPPAQRRTADRAPLLELVDDGSTTGGRVPSESAKDAGGPAAAGAADDPPGRAGGSRGTGTEPRPATGTAASGGSTTSSSTRKAKPTNAGSEAVPGESPTAPKSGAKAANHPASQAPPAAPVQESGADRPSERRPAAGGVNMSAEELATASGLDVLVVRELQEYGLLAAVSVAGVEHFDEEALTVATVAAGFTRFGIEPRHLRLYKNAAEREAGFVEQVVLPLVRQRNPEARARAHETAEELTQLGQQLRGSLLRTALGNLLNG